MTELVVFPDLVKAVIPYLSAQLTALGEPAPVSSRVPNPRPTRLVKVQQTGGSRANILVARPSLLVECWDGDDAKAFRLASVCAAILEAATRGDQPIAAGVWIGGTPEDFSVPVLFPDPLTNSPRFQFTATPTLTGSAI
jgi:hypothetical protein